MTRPQITISAYPIAEAYAGGVTIELGLGKNYPSRRVEIGNVPDCKAALQAFAKELEATQKAWRLMVSFDHKTGRKPNGFDKASQARELETDVNKHLAKAG